jgi:RNA polymerase sigma-70 factor (ECF subfamily)
MYLTGNKADAEDAVQEAILRAVRYFPTLRDDDAREADMISIDAVGPQLVDHRERPDMAAERLQLQQRVRAAVDQLPPLLREAIVLRELQSCSYAEVAAVTEVPVGTVMSRLSRARARLTVLLSDVVVFGDAL